jgi:hypothetical protein
MLWFTGLCLLLFAVAKLWEYHFTPRKAAQEIVADTKAIYSDRHDFAEVSARDTAFRHLDHAFYERALSEFTAGGFRYLADMEDRTLSRQFPQMRTFVRMFVGDEGATSGAAFHAKVRGWMRLLKLVGLLPARPFYFDLETEFSDGTFIVTTNTLGADLSAEVPGVERQAVPQNTLLPEMLRTHRSAVERKREDAVFPLKMHSVGEVWAMQHRLQEVKNAAKAALGFVDHEQIARVMARVPADDSPSQARKDEAFTAELIRLRQQNFSGRSENA